MPGSGNRWKNMTATMAAEWEQAQREAGKPQQTRQDREPAAKPPKRSRRPPSRRTAPTVVDAGNGAERASQEQADAKHSPRR